MLVKQLTAEHSTALTKFLVVEHVGKLGILHDLSIKNYFLSNSRIGICIGAFDEDEIKTTMLTSLEGEFAVTRSIHGTIGSHVTEMLNMLDMIIKDRSELKLTKLAFLVQETKASDFQKAMSKSNFSLDFNVVRVPALKIPGNKMIWDDIMGKHIPHENLTCLTANLK